MSNKYFSATDGTITVFRASATRTYQSALKLRNGISFSATPANLMEGAMPAVEITKGEYDALCALKVQRLKATGKSYYTKPGDSWVKNTSLPATEKQLKGAAANLSAVINKPFRDAAQAAKVGKIATEAATKIAASKKKHAAVLKLLPSDHGDEAIPARKPAKAAQAAKAPTKTAKAATDDAKAPTGNRAIFAKLCLRAQGATRPEMQKAAGSKTMPSSNDLTVLAERLGYELYADKAARADVLVYQFVRPGAAATAY